MRRRDVQAIVFCVLSTLALFAVLYLVTGSYFGSLALVAAYDAWLLTRPRMQRVIRRLRGAPDWSGYYKDD